MGKCKKGTYTDGITKAYEEIGVPTVDSYKEGEDIGFALPFTTAAEGRRMSTGKLFLAAAKDRPNLHVVKNAIVKKVHISNNRVESVSFIYNDTIEMTINASKEVILSAGTLGTPQILLRSGVGPQEDLEKLDIQVHRNLSVGENLQNHPFVPLYFTVPAEPASRTQFLENMNEFLMHNSGPLTSVSWCDQAMVKLDVNSASLYPDFQVFFYSIRRQSGFNNVISDFHEEIYKSLEQAHEDYDMIIVGLTLLRPESRGSVKLRSSDYKDHPMIDANCFSEQIDFEKTLEAAKMHINLLDTASFKDMGVEMLKLNLTECNQYAFKSDEYLRCYIKYITGQASHPTGTSKMGPEHDPTAVVDAELKVRGIEGLRVIDASIMPNVISGNTNAPSIMIGERGSDFIKSTWGNL